MQAYSIHLQPTGNLQKLEVRLCWCLSPWETKQKRHTDSSHLLIEINRSSREQRDILSQRLKPARGITSLCSFYLHRLFISYNNNFILVKTNTKKKSIDFTVWKFSIRNFDNSNSETPETLGFRVINRSHSYSIIFSTKTTFPEKKIINK